MLSQDTKLFSQMIGPLFDMFTGAMFVFSSVKLLDMCKPRTGWLFSIGIFCKWASKPTELAGDGECGLARFYPNKNFVGNAIYHFSRLSHQTGCLFTWEERFILSALYSVTFACSRMLFCIKF